MTMKDLASKKYLEFRRQGFHLIAGCLLVFFLSLDVIGVRTLFLLLLLTCVLSLVLKRTHIPCISEAIEFFERDEERRSERGRGAITFLIGALLAVVLFPKHIAYASLLILAAGDSISHLVGRYLGSTPHPANKAKNIEGGIAGGVAGGIVASVFVGLWPALLASFLTMAAEMIIPLQSGWRRFVADDNIILPLAAGIVLTTIL